MNAAAPQGPQRFLYLIFTNTLTVRKCEIYTAFIPINVL
jgi:hypothetical protein